MNKFSKIVITFCLVSAILFNAFSVCVFADTNQKIRQIDSNLPKVKFEIEGSFSSDEITSIKIDNESLKVKDAKPAKDAEGRLVYYLIDTSTSMSQATLDAIKPQLIAYADSLSKDDSLVLMTFGKKVSKVLKGGESKSEIHKTINSIKCNSQGTAFYQAILDSVNDSKGKKDYERKYAIIISDGADFEKGNSSQQEVVDEIETNILPFYGLCLSSASKSNADGFGYITRASGGDLVRFSRSDAAKKFKSLDKIIDNVTIVSANSKTRKPLGKCDFFVNAKKGGKTYSAKDIINASAKKDNAAPEVDDISYNKETNSFKIQFNEGVEKADSISSYTVKKLNKELTILSVKYYEEEEYALLNMDGRIYSGEYTFEFKHITDNSGNENKLSETSVTKKIKAIPVIVKILIIFGIVLIPVLFLLAIYIILISIKKKKNVSRIKDIFIVQEEVVENEHIKIEQKTGRKLFIHIQSGDGSIHDIEYNLVNSVIFGRSNICDITISDANMSRQHFVVEDVETGLAVSDLETTNGTFVNGVRIHSRTFLDANSTITAGNSTIKITY